MLVATAWYSVLRPVNPASRTITRIFQRHALPRAPHNTPAPRSRALRVQRFHTTDFLGATHRSAPRHAHRDWKPPGPLRTLTRRFNAIPSNYILFGVLGINGVVFAAWSYVLMFQVRCPFRHSPSQAFEPLDRLLTRLTIPQGSPSISRPPPSARWLARWLQDNFINSYENLRKGRLYVQCPARQPELTTHIRARTLPTLIPISFLAGP
jgi:hypothetical protein